MRRPGGDFASFASRPDANERPKSPREESSRSGAQKKRLSYKEQREFDALEAELEQLNAEKAQIETLLAAGTASYEDIRTASQRYETLKAELDAKETRWLELSL